MIKQVYLFTTRNVIAFDEKGEQDIEIQQAISWDVQYVSHSKEEEALARIIADDPEIFLAKWQGWSNRITLDELCSLLGYGRWYWEHYKQKSGGDSGE